MGVTIQSLKHMAFRIWAATVITIPLSLWLLSMLTNKSGLVLPLGLLLFLFALSFAGCGWLSSQLALRQLSPMLHEAGVWERSGDLHKAENTYQKALALYDSFLISPRARRIGLPPLVARMARMYAAQTDRHATADLFIDAYLSAYPDDHDIAENWLQTREYHGGLDSRQQDLAIRIGEAHADNMAIQTILARLYLLTQRTDFPALQTYRRAMASSPSNASSMAVDLAKVFIQEGRSDEWALPVYLRAAGQQPPWEALRCGIAACVRWIRPSDRNADLLARAKAIIGSTEEELLARMSSGFVPPSGSYPAIDTQGVKDARQTLGPAHDGIFTPLKEIGARIKQVRQHLQTVIVNPFRRSPSLRRAVTWSLIMGLGVMAALFLVNTIGYLTPSPVSEPQPVETPPETPPLPPMPYTLQVAAYLKPEHADRYINSLKKQAIDAYLVKAHGNDKIWYQVRIAHFPDKASARTYGSRLKSQGIIEDFYVARDQNP